MAVETLLCTALHCNRTQADVKELVQQVQPGILVGSECTNEDEPYIVSLALTVEQQWEGADGWMGKIVASS